MTIFHKTTFAVFLEVLVITSVTASEDVARPNSTTRNSRIIVYSYPPSKPPEPYTYPGPSPPVIPPPRATEPYVHPTTPSRTPEQLPNPVTNAHAYPFLPTRIPDPYPMYAPPMYRPNLDFQHLPKWCKAMWERDDCGMKCWMLRKICRNMHKQFLSEKSRLDDSKVDAESSPSLAYPYLYNYFRKPQPPITYSKAGLPNTYYAQPAWAFPNPYHRRYPYNYHKYSSVSNELGLNPHFTYVDGYEKLVRPTKTETETEEDEAPIMTTTTTTTTTTEATMTSNPEKAVNNSTITTISKPKKKKINLGHTKGAFPVQVTYSYPQESEVTTLSPFMFDYDQYSNRKYYGDRIYMSTVIPVASRHLESHDPDNDSFGDFDELISLMDT